MGKPKKSNIAPERKVPLEQQLMDGKVVKQKVRNKVHIRAEESSVGATLLSYIQNELYLHINYL